MIFILFSSESIIPNLDLWRSNLQLVTHLWDLPPFSVLQMTGEEM